MAMEFLAEFTWEDYPNLCALHKLFMNEVPEFAQVYEPLVPFRDKYIELRDHGPPDSLINNVYLGFVTAFYLIPTVVWNKALYFMAPFGPRSARSA